MGIAVKYFLPLVLCLSISYFQVLSATEPAAEKQPQKKNTADQSSKEAVVLTFSQAISTADVDLMWEILSPDLRKKILTVCPIEKIAKELLLRQITAKQSESRRKAITNALKTDDGRKMLVKSAISRDPEAYIEKDGKWFVDLEKIKK